MFLCFYKYILIIFNFNSFLFTNNLNKEECNNEKSYYDIIQTMTIQHKNLKKQINQEITILINKITPIIKKYNIPLEDNQSLIYEISQVKKIFMGPNFYELLITIPMDYYGVLNAEDQQIMDEVLENFYINYNKVLEEYKTLLININQLLQLTPSKNQYLKFFIGFNLKKIVLKCHRILINSLIYMTNPNILEDLNFKKLLKIEEITENKISIYKLHQDITIDLFIEKFNDNFIKNKFKHMKFNGSLMISMAQQIKIFNNINDKESYPQDLINITNFFYKNITSLNNEINFLQIKFFKTFRDYFEKQYRTTIPGFNNSMAVSRWWSLILLMEKDYLHLLKPSQKKEFFHLKKQLQSLYEKFINQLLIHINLLQKTLNAIPNNVINEEKFLIKFFIIQIFQIVTLDLLKKFLCFLQPNFENNDEIIILFNLTEEINNNFFITFIEKFHNNWQNSLLKFYDNNLNLKIMDEILWKLLMMYKQF